MTGDARSVEAALLFKLHDIKTELLASLPIEECYQADGRALSRLVRECVEAEREACARMAETQYRRDPDGIDAEWNQEGTRSRVQARIAAAIRSRSTSAIPEEER